MPHIAIKMYPGRTKEVKKELAEKAKDFIMKEMNLPENVISVSIEEIAQEQWKEAVVDKIDEQELYIKANF